MSELPLGLGQLPLSGGELRCQAAAVALQAGQVSPGLVQLLFQVLDLGKKTH